MKKLLFLSDISLVLPDTEREREEEPGDRLLPVFGEFFSGRSLKNQQIHQSKRVQTK